jgi:two-component system phosphate regulon response regulator PhoB
MSAKLLIIEDEPDIREMLDFTLTRAGHQVTCAADAEAARAALKVDVPDLILLDWMLPETSGLVLAREIKRQAVFRPIPIIMLTARAAEDDKVQGLDAGVDDYITKPFSPRELLARIKAVLRRARPQSDETVVEVDGLRLDPVEHRVQAAGNFFDLGPTEFRLLHFFMTHPERVYSRGQLLDQVWGDDVYVEERTVDVHIRRLRKALEPFGHDSRVQTVRGSGYRFTARS